MVILVVHCKEKCALCMESFEVKNLNIKVYMAHEKNTPSFFLDAVKEYEKRLSRYCKIKRVAFKSIDQLAQKCPDGALVFHVTHDGTITSSEALSEKIHSLGLSGISDLIFVIGTWDLPMPHEKLTLCTSSLPLGLSTTVLYEQIYRAYRILRGEPYHK